MNASLRTILYLAVCVALTLADGEGVTSELPVSVSASTPVATSREPISSVTTEKIALRPQTTKIPPTTTNIPPTTTNIPPTTTNVPSTTSTPEPVVEGGKWNVTEGNTTCIRLQLRAEFIVNIEDKKYNIALSPLANSTGDCNVTNTSQFIALSYDHYYALMFEFEKNSTRTYVKNITFTLTTSEGTEVFYNDTELFGATYGRSYMCRSDENILMGNATMQVQNIHLQSFGTKEEKDFSDAEECEADDTISNIVPIAVACALAALIVVVLIAYLVGRRRNRQKGYTSV